MATISNTSYAFSTPFHAAAPPMPQPAPFAQAPAAFRLDLYAGTSQKAPAAPPKGGSAAEELAGLLGKLKNSRALQAIQNSPAFSRLKQFFVTIVNDPAFKRLLNPGGAPTAPAPAPVPAPPPVQEGPVEAPPEQPAPVKPVPVPAGRTADAPAWVGDYQSGNLSQWSQVHVAKADGVVVVSDPVRDGFSKAAKFTVRPGDRTFGQVNEERAEVMSNVEQSGSVEGAETWQAWSSLFPAGTAVEKGSWLAFSQWHQTANTCPPNVAFMITDGAVPRIRLSVRGGDLDFSTGAAEHAKTYDLGPLPIDSWTDFTVHSKWSSDPTRGMIEVKINGRTVLPPTPVANLYTGQSAYFKQGIYRGNMSRTTTIYHTGTRRGATESSVSLAGTNAVAAPAAKTMTVGNGSRTLSGTNIQRTTDSLVAYDRSSGWTTSPANPYGFEAAVVDGKVVAVSDLQSGMAIPENGMVLSGHGAARDWLKLHATVGATVALA